MKKKKFHTSEEKKTTTTTKKNHFYLLVAYFNLQSYDSLFSSLFFLSGSHWPTNEKSKEGKKTFNEKLKFRSLLN